jgi:hypothetical protein
MGRELDALSGQRSWAKVTEEHEAIFRGALLDEPPRDEFRVGIDGCPRPHVAVAERSNF